MLWINFSGGSLQRLDKKDAFVKRVSPQQSMQFEELTRLLDLGKLGGLVAETPRFVIRDHSPK